MSSSINQPTPPPRQYLRTTIGVVISLFLLVICYVTIFFDPIFRKVVLHNINKNQEVKIEISQARLNILGGLEFQGGGIRILSLKENRLLFTIRNLSVQFQLHPLENKKLSIVKAIAKDPRVYLYPKNSFEQAQAKKLSPNFSLALISNVAKTSSLREWQEKIISFMDRTSIHVAEELVVENAGGIIRAEENLTVFPGTLVSFRLVMDRPTQNQLSISLNSITIDQKKLSKSYIIQPKNLNSHDIWELDETPQTPPELLSIYNHLPNLNRIPFKGSVSIKNLLSTQPIVEIDLSNNKINKFDLEWVRLLLPSSIQKHLLKVSLKTGINLFSLRGKIPLDKPDSVVNRIHLSFSTKLNEANLVANNINILIPKIEGEATLENGMLDFSFYSNPLNGELLFASRSSIENIFFKSLNSGETVHSRIDLKNIQIESLIHPRLKSAFPIEGTVSGRLEIKGFTNNRKLMIFDISTKHLPFDKLKIRTLSGQVNFSHGAFLHNTVLIDPLTLQFTHGSIKLNGAYYLDSDSIIATIHGKDLMAEEFLKRHLKGSLQFSGKFQGDLKKLKPYKNNIQEVTRPQIIGLLSDGEFKFNISSGQIFKHGVTTPYFNYLSPDNSKLKNESIYFDYFGGDFKVNEGILSSKNIKLENSSLKTKSEWFINSIKSSISGKIMSTKGNRKKNLLTIKGTFQNPLFKNINSSDLAQQLKN